MRVLLATGLLPVLFLLWLPRSETLYAPRSGCGLGEETAETTEPVVNLTSGPISPLEESSGTVECTFETNANNLTVHVEWYKRSESAAEGQNHSQAQCVGTNSTNLTLTAVANTAIYVCMVVIAERNLTGRGNGMRVTVFAQHQEAPQPNVPQQDTKPGLDLLLYAMFGVVVGVFFSLPAFCFMVWRCKTNSNGKPEKKEAVEMNGPSTPPLAPQTDEVTYADLDFEKEEPKAASEAVYAMVTRWQKPREESADATYAKVKVSH